MPLVRIGQNAIDTDLIACVVLCNEGTFVHSKHGLGKPGAQSRSAPLVRVLLKGDLGEIQFAGDGARAVLEFVRRLPEPPVSGGKPASPP